MGITITLTTTVLDSFAAGLDARLTAARKDIAEKIAVEWAADVLAREVSDDTPPGRPDYDENIVTDEDGPGRTLAYTEIEWAPKVEYGDVAAHFPARPSATTTGERNRPVFEQAIRDAVAGP